MHEVLVNRLGGLSLPRKSVVRLTDRPDMTLDVYPGRKTTQQEQQYLLVFDRDVGSPPCSLTGKTKKHTKKNSTTEEDLPIIKPTKSFLQCHIQLDQFST